jgi:septal ring factor EnvC (AmiA/AmiB activator)
MFGSRKKKVQVKSVEDYLKGEDARVPTSETKPVSKSSPAIPAKATPFAIGGVVALFILVLMLVAFSQLNSLKSEVAELRTGKEGDTRALRMQVAELAVKLEKSNKQVEALTNNISALQRDLETEKSSRIRAEAAAAAARKQVASTDKKKKAVKTTPR